MAYESFGVASELKEVLIKYITLFEPNIKGLEELSYGELLEKYRNILCNKSDYGHFIEIIEECIEDYKRLDPDTSLSDLEIIYANNILDPINFIDLLVRKTKSIEKKLNSLRMSKKFLEENAYKFNGKEFAYDRMHSEIAKNTKIYTNYFEKCHRIMQKIEETITQGNTR